MISLEEKLLVNILYRQENEVLKGIDPDNINFEKLITLASGHLMLPALFFNIQKKKVTYLFPEDFIEYIKNIFEINKARNKILLSEAEELSELLYKNNIKHIFLKGTALLLSNVFEDIGERMVTDIDFIIQHKDEEKVIKLFNKHNYFGKSPKLYQTLFKIFKPIHLPRRVNEKKIIAIEPHLELLSPKYRFVFNSKKLINAFKEKTKTIKTPNKSFLFDHCIYALQIDDKGFIKSYHFHRSIYDIYKLDCKNSLVVKNIKKDIFIKHFFQTIDKFKIFDIHIKTTLLSSYFDKLFRFLVILDSRFFSFKIPNKIIQLFFYKEIRKRDLKKISTHYNNKTLINFIYTWLKA